MSFLHCHLSKLLLLAILVVSAITAVPTTAQEPSNDPSVLLREAGQSSGFQTFNEDEEQVIASRFIGNVYRWFVSFLGVVFMTYIIYGGYTWMTSSGNEEKVARAKKTIGNGIWGLIIILAASGFLYLVDQAISIGGSQSVGVGGS